MHRADDRRERAGPAVARRDDLVVGQPPVVVLVGRRREPRPIELEGDVPKGAAAGGPIVGERPEPAVPVGGTFCRSSAWGTEAADHVVDNVAANGEK